MRKSPYAPASLKSAQDLVRYFLFVLKTEYRPHPTNRTTLKSNRVCRARHNHEIHAFRERSRRTMYRMYVRVQCCTLYVARHAQACTSRLHSSSGKTQSLHSTKDATEATHSYNKRRRHFPVLVSSNTPGTEVRSHCCLVGALGGMCVRQHQCDHVATANQTQIAKLRREEKKKQTVSPL